MTFYINHERNTMNMTPVSVEYARKPPPASLKYGDGDNDDDENENEDIIEKESIPEYGLTNDETEDEDEEWVDKDNENYCIVKSKKCRKKRKVKSATGVSMIKHNATTKKISLKNNNKLKSTKIVTMIEDTNNDNDIATAQTISPSTTNNNVQTITFNVGGTKYTVSRSLLELFPNTLLAREVSNVCSNKNGNQMFEPIFIESDADRFRWILDYMRHGVVIIPWSISKAALINDLKYLGFDVDPQNIRMDVHLPDVANLVAQVRNKQNALMEIIGSEAYKKMKSYESIECETHVELQNRIVSVNAERDRLVNSAKLIASKKISDLREQQQASHMEYLLERKYLYLFKKCSDHYMATSQLEFKLECPNRTKEEFERCGCYVTHTTRSDFVNETKKVYDDLIVKRIANLFGLSHVYAYYKAGSLSDSEKKTDDLDLEYEVKFGMLPRTINLETIAE